MEYHKCKFELEGTPDRYTHCCCRYLNRWNHPWKGEEKGHDVVHEPMEVQCYRARAQNHHPAVVPLINMLFFLCGGDGGQWCKRRCTSTSSSSKDTVDQDPCFSSKLKCRNMVEKCIDGHLATHIIKSRQFSETATPRFTVYQNVVLPIPHDFCIPPSHSCKVFNRSLNLNPPWISKSIVHLRSARHGDCYAHSKDPPMPSAWVKVVTVC